MNVIPVITTINGLVNKESLKVIKEQGVIIQYEIMVKDIIIINMKDIMK